MPPSIKKTKKSGPQLNPNYEIAENPDLPDYWTGKLIHLPDLAIAGIDSRCFEPSNFNKKELMEFLEIAQQHPILVTGNNQDGANALEASYDLQFFDGTKATEVDFEELDTDNPVMSETIGRYRTWVHNQGEHYVAISFESLQKGITFAKAMRERTGPLYDLLMGMGVTDISDVERA